MTRLLISLLFFFHCFVVLAQLNSTKETSESKDGYYIFYGKDRPESGILPEGKVEEGMYVNDRKEGLWIKYFDDGITPKLKGHYANNRPCGTYEKFHENGALREKGCVKKNVWSDSLIRYFENGVVEYAAFYDSLGKENGLVTFYYSNGMKEIEYLAKNGIPTGTYYRYYHNGDTMEVVSYDQTGNAVFNILKSAVNPLDVLSNAKNTVELPPDVGAKPTTQNQKWNPNGRNVVLNETSAIWQDGIFVNGRLYNGKIYFYDDSGILLKVQHYVGSNISFESKK